MGKGEIARYEQFLLFPLCFQKACTKNPGLVWERVNLSQNVMEIISKFVAAFYEVVCLSSLGLPKMQPNATLTYTNNQGQSTQY